MDPVGLSTRPDGEWLIIHRCTRCGELGANRVAGDDNARALVRMAVRPLAAARPSAAGIARRVLIDL
jgi:hypothetical protein